MTKRSFFVSNGFMLPDATLSVNLPRKAIVDIIFYTYHLLA